MEKKPYCEEGLLKNFLLTSLVATLATGTALISQHAQLGAETSVNECSKELLLAFFPESFVNETLKKFEIPEKDWVAINQDLKSKDGDVIKIVEEKASKMDPNPLKDPQQRQGAVKIFRETLFDIFAGVMKSHGVTDDKKIQSMLDDIQQQKAKRFMMCMEKQKKGDDTSSGSKEDTSDK